MSIPASDVCCHILSPSSVQHSSLIWSYFTTIVKMNMGEKLVIKREGKKFMLIKINERDFLNFFIFIKILYKSFKKSTNVFFN